MPTPPPANPKADLRRQYRRRRRAISDTERRRLDASINQAIIETLGAETPGTVSAFLAADGEPDPAPAMHFLTGRGWRVAVPVIVDGRPSRLEFHRWNAASKLARNRFGIDEPPRSDALDIGEFRFMLLPLVAFDAKGARLGMGGGFYDRFLAALGPAPEVVLVGVAYDVQEAPELPIEPWDVPIHAIVTESGWRPFGRA